MNSKVKIESYQLRVNNSEDETRVYNISCSIDVKNGKVTNINSGNVQKGGTYVADFNKNGSNFNIGFHNVPESEQCDINNAINAFIEEATSSALATSL